MKKLQEDFQKISVQNKVLQHKLKISQQKNRRFEKRIKSLSSLFKHLRRKDILSKDASEVVNVRYTCNCTIMGTKH